MLTPSDLKWFRGVSRISARGVLKVRPGGGGGGAIRFRSDTKSGGGGGGGEGVVWHKVNYKRCNFDQGGAQALHTRANELNCRF